MVKTPKLVPTLSAEGYELCMINRVSNDYNVMEGDEIIGRIRVHLKCVESNTGTEISYVPYDLDIDVICSTEGIWQLIDLFKKMIMATVS